MTLRDKIFNMIEWCLLKNKYQGKECVIIGNGPSVNMDDLKKIQKSGKILFVCNRFHLAYEQIDISDFDPHFIVSIDPQMIKDFGEEIIVYRRNAKVLIGSDKILDFKGSFLPFRIINRVPFQFATTPHKMISTGSSVVIAAIQLAYYMGMKTIYLYGIDHNFSYENQDENGMVEGEENHFIKNYRNHKKWYPPCVEEIEKAFSTSDDFLKSHGGTLINCSRMTKLPIIEKRNLDDCL